MKYGQQVLLQNKTKQKMACKLVFVFFFVRKFNLIKLSKADTDSSCIHYSIVFGPHCALSVKFE